MRLTNQKNLRLASGMRTPGPGPAPNALKPSTQPSPGSEPGQVISSSPDQSNPSPSEASDPALPADDERCEKKGRARAPQRGLPYATPNHYQTSPLQSQTGTRQLQVHPPVRGLVKGWVGLGE